MQTRSLNRIWKMPLKSWNRCGRLFFLAGVNEEEAKEEADFVLEHLKGQELQMPVVYDPEHILEDEARTDGDNGRTIYPKCEGIL